MSSSPHEDSLEPMNYGEEEEEEEYVDSRVQDFRLVKNKLIDYILNVKQKELEKLQKLSDQLRTQKIQLEQELEQSRQNVEELENEKQSLLDLNDEALANGDFFQQMKFYEYQEAELKGELKGITKVSKDLSDQIKIQEKKNASLNKQINNRLSKIPGGVINPKLGEGEVNNYRKQLSDLEDEIQQLQYDCEDLRAQIREKSAQLQHLSVDNINELNSQKREIEDEIEFKKKQLKKLLLDEKRLTTSRSIENEKEKNIIEQMDLDDPWESERKNLLNSIAHVQNEMEDLCAQLNIDPNNIPEPRTSKDAVSVSQYSVATNKSGSSRRSKGPLSISQLRRSIDQKIRDDESDALSKISQQSFSSEKVRYTHENLKAALRYEIEALNDESSPINVSIKVEERYSEEIKKQLAEIEESIAQIEKFSQKTFGDSETNTDAVMWQQRIDVLENEYMELRNSKA